LGYSAILIDQYLIHPSPENSPAGNANKKRDQQQNIICGGWGAGRERKRERDRERDRERERGRETETETDRGRE